MMQPRLRVYPLLGIEVRQCGAELVDRQRPVDGRGRVVGAGDGGLVGRGRDAELVRDLDAEPLGGCLRLGEGDQLALPDVVGVEAELGQRLLDGLEFIDPLPQLGLGLEFPAGDVAAIFQIGVQLLVDFLLEDRGEVGQLLGLGDVVAVGRGLVDDDLGARLYDAHRRQIQHGAGPERAGDLAGREAAMLATGARRVAIEGGNDRVVEVFCEVLHIDLADDGVGQGLGRARLDDGDHQLFLALVERLAGVHRGGGVEHHLRVQLLGEASSPSK